jgi:hypothetical protein
MPQLDIDLFEDFLFFAFLSLLFGFGDEESEEGLIDVCIDSFLVEFYLSNKKKLILEESLIKEFVVSSVVHN